MPQALPQGVNPYFVKLVDGIYYDLCVSCSVNTGVRTDCHLDARSNYIGECGQLCQKCYKEIYGPK